MAYVTLKSRSKLKEHIVALFNYKSNYFLGSINKEIINLVSR